jgi:hypothetical protein
MSNEIINFDGAIFIDSNNLEESGVQDKQMNSNNHIKKIETDLLENSKNNMISLDTMKNYIKSDNIQLVYKKPTTFDNASFIDNESNNNYTSNDTSAVTASSFANNDYKQSLLNNNLVESELSHDKISSISELNTAEDEKLKFTPELKNNMNLLMTDYNIMNEICDLNSLLWLIVSALVLLVILVIIGFKMVK